MKMYGKMKELGPVGGHALGTPPRSANGYSIHLRFMDKGQCGTIGKELPSTWIKDDWKNNKCKVLGEVWPNWDHRPNFDGKGW